MEHEKLMTLKEVAEMLGLAERTVREKAGRGDIPCRIKFRTHYFLYSEIVKFIDETGVKPHISKKRKKKDDLS